ncbi:MAG: PDZ domain-containing protein [Granulosicoccus sp.]
MKSNSAGHILANAALALFAGVLGSLVTLLVTSNLQVPAVNLSAEKVADGSIGDGADLLVKPSNNIDKNSLASSQVRDSQSFTALRDALEEATAERAQLAQVLAQLTRQVESIESDVINQQAMQALEGSVLPESSQQNSGNGHNGFANGFANGFNESVSTQSRIDSLVSAGVDFQSAQALQARQDQYQLARLELFDQAQREGWNDTDQFAERLAALNEQRLDLRKELGDDAYDRYLFEAGQSNRVAIDSVIPGSAAEIAGLEPGDRVISYANGRIFSTRDLQRATRAGIKGESVSLNVDRQGQSLFFDIQRGPLGVTLRQEQQNPS